MDESRDIRKALPTVRTPCVKKEAFLNSSEQRMLNVENKEPFKQNAKKKEIILVDSARNVNFAKKAGSNSRRKICPDNEDVSLQEDFAEQENGLLWEENKEDNDVQSAKENKPECSNKKIGAYYLSEILMELFSFILFEDQLYTYQKDEGFWKMLCETESQREIRKMIPEGFREGVSRSVLCEIYEWLRTQSPVVERKLLQSKYFLNFKDCAINWRNGNECDKRKKLYFRYVLQLEYSSLENSGNGAYVQFLDDVFGDDSQTKREFRKFIGLCLSDIRNLKICFFLYGVSNSGKSVVLNLLKKLVGAEWCSSLSFSQMDSEFAITQLLGKRLNLSGEVSGASNKRLDIFKSLTGNDTVTACFKGKDHFQFENQSLLVFACNSFPKIQALEEFDSFLSRVIIFPFLNAKPREQWVDNLEELLMADSRAIIDDAFRGLRELEEDDYCFNETDSMKKCKQEFIGTYNSFALFAEKAIVYDCRGTVKSRDIKKAYQKFCDEEGYPALADNVWGPYLKTKYGCISKTLTITDGIAPRRIRGYQGISLLKCEDDILGEEEEYYVAWNEGITE